MDQTSWDIVTASNVGAVVSAVVAFPQLVKALRERESVRGISSFGLVLQVIAILLFGYVNVRLGLWLAAAQNVGVLATLVFLMALKFRPQRPFGTVPPQEPLRVAPVEVRAA